MQACRLSLQPTCVHNPSIVVQIMPVQIASGALVKLVAVSGANSSHLVRMRSLPNGSTIFVTESQSGSLRIRANGSVDWAGARGPWAQFLVEHVAEQGDASNPRIVHLKSVGHAQQGRDVYLEAVTDIFRSTRHTAGDGTCFTLVPVEDAAQRERPSTSLSAEQTSSFMRDGFVVLRGLVSPGLVEDALRAINSSLPVAQALDERGGLPAVHNLLVQSPVLSAAEQLLGLSIGLKNAGGQVALRFPLDPTEAHRRSAKADEQWHIDSMARQAHMSGFQLLVGIALSAQPGDDYGNLHLWPGEHVTIHDAVRRARLHPDAPPADASAADSGNFWCGQRPDLPAAGRLQVRLQPGDVVLAHQKMPHSTGINRSPHIRYQVYFRLSATDFVPAAAPLRGLFDGWHGLAQLERPQPERQCESLEASVGVLLGSPPLIPDPLV